MKWIKIKNILPYTLTRLINYDSWEIKIFISTSTIGITFKNVYMRILLKREIVEGLNLKLLKFLIKYYTHVIAFVWPYTTTTVIVNLIFFGYHYSYMNHYTFLLLAIQNFNCTTTKLISVKTKSTKHTSNQGLLKKETIEKILIKWFEIREKFYSTILLSFYFHHSLFFFSNIRIILKQSWA